MLLNKKRILMIVLGTMGFMISFLYDSMTSLAFPLASGFNSEQIIAGYLAGLPFYIFHMISNALIFAFILGPTLVHIFEYFPDYKKS